jgi:hypothetical protein
MFVWQALKKDQAIDGQQQPSNYGGVVLLKNSMRGRQRQNCKSAILLGKKKAVETVYVRGSDSILD